MNKTLTWTVIIVVAAALIWFLFGNKETEAPTQIPTASEENTNMPAAGENSTETSVTVEAGATVNTLPKTATITYTDSGFTPQTVTIANGGKVNWVNKSSNNMWVASAMHPSHSVYSGTTLSQHCPNTSGSAFDECANGNSYGFTFTKTGEWKYHNHSLSSHFGTVIVK
ncbi:MAG TPA: hypothetical protein VJC12_00625 [Candidatus Paceibacterota bacterium]